MRINQLKAGSLLSYIQMILSVIISLVYTPIVLNSLGQGEYGLYQTVSSAVTMLTMLNLGLNVSYIHFYSKYMQKKDIEGQARFNGLYITILSVLAMVCLTIGLIMTNNMHWIFADGLTEAEYPIARTMMILLVVNVTVSFPISTFTGLLSANEQFVFLHAIQIVKNVVTHGLSVVVLYAGYRSVGIVCVTVAVSILMDIAYVVYAFVKLRCRIKFGKWEKGLFKALLIFTSFIAMNVLIDQINFNVAKMLLARFCGTETVAVYNIGFLIYTYYQTMSTSIAGVLAPRVHKYVYETNENKEKQRNVLTDLFIKVGRIQFFILGLVCTGFLFFGKTFITCYWANEEYINAYYVALIMLFSGMIPLIQNVGITILQAQNKHKFRSVLYLFIAMFNVVLTAWLCQNYGELGAPVGTACSMLLGNALIMNIYYHKKANIDIVRFWKVIARAAAGIILPVVAGFICCPLLDQTNILCFLLGILGYCCIYGVSVWLISMNPEEKAMVLGPLQMIRKR